MLNKLFLFIISTTLLTSCGLNDDITKKDSPTTGKINLFYDEGLTLHIIKFQPLKLPIHTLKSI